MTNEQKVEMIIEYLRLARHKKNPNYQQMAEDILQNLKSRKQKSDS